MATKKSLEVLVRTVQGKANKTSDRQLKASFRVGCQTDSGRCSSWKGKSIPLDAAESVLSQSSTSAGVASMTGHGP